MGSVGGTLCTYLEIHTSTFIRTDFLNCVILPLFCCRLSGCNVFQPITLTSIFVQFYQGILEYEKRIQRRRILKIGNSQFLMPQQPMFSNETKSLNNFEREPSKKENYCEVWMKSVTWFRRCYLKLKVNDDGQSDHNRSHSAFGSGARIYI